MARDNDQVPHHIHSCASCTLEVGPMMFDNMGKNHYSNQNRSVVL